VRLQRLKFSRKSKLILILLFILIILFCIEQAVVYFVPPSKGKQCQQGLDNAEPSVQLIPEASNKSNSNNSPLITPVPSTAGLKVNDRSGFGLASSADSVFWSTQLGTSWYLDWDVEPISSKQEPTHWQMVRLKPGCIYPSEKYIRWAARRYPGNIWVIGNEPDVALQDDLTPDEYAQDYHNLYTLIKQADRTASIAVGGVAQATPLRFRYLDDVLNDYKKNYGESMPVDWWTLHGYVLQEKRGDWGVGIPPGFSDDQGELYTIEDHGNLELFKQQIINFRIWMAENGYREKPLALTEFGTLFPESLGYSQYMVSKYLEASVAWLDSAMDDKVGLEKDENHLVQKWAWFSLSDPYFATSDLVDLKTGSLTIIGEAYREFNMKAGD
jgi:hypothetical protein